jgi:hypothetical protein
MRRVLGLLLIVVTVGALHPVGAGAAEWHSQQPVSAGIEVPANLGAIGDIQCWSANRCVLINPKGLYAWDGVEWHPYSTVCGGQEGRIAWAGPDEFWTVSDQQAGQQVAESSEGGVADRSLCHFVNGAVVASYAEPIGVQTSYLPMNAAACLAPDDCWFGGERLGATAVNSGAFHLHWNGSSMTEIPSLSQPEPSLNDPGRTVESLATFQGRYYESVKIQKDDRPAVGESVEQPARLHRLSAGAATPFQALPTTVELGEGPPSALGAFHLATDGNQLWAVAGAGEGSAPVTAMRFAGGLFSQITLQDPGEVFAPGDEVTGLAVEPGSEGVWVSYLPPGENSNGIRDPAHLAKIEAAGTVGAAVFLPEAAEAIGHKGGAGPIACPAAGQCWMGTSEGWLFHLGPNLPRDEDPAMHVLITSRPKDNGLPSGVRDEIFESEARSAAEEAATEPLVFPQEKPPRPRAKKLVTHIHQKLIHKTVLLLTFQLQAKAHVQLLARRHKKVVAKTARLTMGKGKHSLRLRLDPKKWPTGLDFEVHAIKKKKKAKAKAKAASLPATESPALAALRAPIGEQLLSSSPASGAPSLAAFDPPATASEAGPPEALVGTPVIGIPAPHLIGASPLEAPGEIWATSSKLLWHYTEATGWQALQPAVGPLGEALPGTRFARGALSAAVTPKGALAAFIESNGAEGAGPAVVVREPGAAVPHELPSPAAEMLPEEELFSASQLIQPVEEVTAATGVYVVPTPAAHGIQNGVLHWNGVEWAREQICAPTSPAAACEEPTATFRVVGLGATSSTNAWILGSGGEPGAGLQLYHREVTITGPVWRAAALGPEGSVGSLFAAPSSELLAAGVPVEVKVLPSTTGQPLTVTETGVWVDAQLSAAEQAFPATVYFNLGRKEVTGSWCDVALESAASTKLCGAPLGAELPTRQGRSFAWPGESEGFGTRVIAGLPNGSILTFDGTTFRRVVLKGGEEGAEFGAAFSAPDDGWLGGQRAAIRVGVAAAAPPSRLVSWPVPFRQPLLAVAPQPGAPTAALESEAIAVGSEGEVARYIPGRGWIEESLLTGGGARAKPRLRAVAWPEPGFAYAVGDNGEMWLWRKSTGFWESDPGKPPNLIRGNFDGVAFDPANPSRGYAVGHQGLLLGFGKQWSQESLPASVNPESEFTSISFAGSEAMVTFEFAEASPEEELTKITGGLLVNEGSGWRVDEGAAAALAGDVPRMVAGLPDGGAVMTTRDNQIFERESATAPWQLAAVEEIEAKALAAFRENGQVRALVASPGVVPEERLSGPPRGENASTFLEEQPAPGQPPLLRKPPGPEGQTYVFRQTATGWRDEENEAAPPPEGRTNGNTYDLPRQPDPIFGLLVSTDGSQGWAVGGVPQEQVETAGVMRYGEAAAPPANAATSPVPIDQTQANFVIGGEAACAGPCADLMGTGIGPDVWLPAAVSRAGSLPGVRAFLYTGAGVAPNLGATLSPTAFAREEQAYAGRLSGGAAPVFAAPAESDRDAAGTGTFLSAFAGFDSPLGSASAESVSEPSSTSSGKAYYSFTSNGSSGQVRVIVLDYSAPTLDAAQRCWLAQELAGARARSTPAIVVGNRDLTGTAPNAATDRAEVAPIVVAGTPPSGCSVSSPGGASAYFFDYPEQDRSLSLSAGTQSIPAIGTGTLGYVRSPGPAERDFAGASGTVLASLNLAQRNPQTNVAPVSVRLIPNISELAIDSTDGTFLRRSQVALFEGLARRPRAGIACSAASGAAPNPETCERRSPDPYIQIPADCLGPKCASAILPEYRFTSSDPEVAQFVAQDPGSLNPRQLELNGENKPIADPNSGLLCAYNAGTTTVTIETGGLSYSTQVIVQEGSVEQPCGTVPRTGVKEAQPQLTVPPPPPPLEPSPTPTPTSLNPHLIPPQPPAPAPIPTPQVTTPPAAQPTPPPVHHPPSPPAPLSLPAFVSPTPIIAPVHVAVPPPPPTAAEPAPPTGTSPVTQPAVSPEPEEEEEAAFDLVHHMVAVDSSSRSQVGGLINYLPVAVLLLAIGGVAVRGRGRSSPKFSYVSNSRRGGSL